MILERHHGLGLAQRRRALLQRRLGARLPHLSSHLFYVLTRALRTRAHSLPQHWLLCHMGEYYYEFEFDLSLKRFLKKVASEASTCSCRNS